MSHQINTTTVGGRKVYTLRDAESGASASILPSFGFNLFDLRLPLAGEVRPVIVSDPDFAENPKDPARNGTPILFPYPNRVALGKFTFHGKAYKLPVNSGAHAIHGFALDAAWEVQEADADRKEASLTGVYQISRQSPDRLADWPTDALLKVRYQLAGRTLTMTVTVTNPTAEDLPYGFGIHPYFRCPFTPGGDQEKTRVVLPAADFWVLDGFIPTGEKRPVDARLDFRKGRPMKGLKLDDVLAGLSYEGDKGVARLVDESLKAEFRLGFDRNVRELVVYTPPGDGGVISLEPYTQTTDAVNLASRNVNGGLRVLKHSGTDTFTITMETAG